MSDLVDKIFQIQQSQSYVEYVKYHKNNIFSITKTARYELMHSAFIAWLLDSSVDNDLGRYPSFLFLRLLFAAGKDTINANSRKIDFDKCIDVEQIIESKTQNEFALQTNKKSRRIDILMMVTYNNGKKMPIIIENKVDAPETNKQTIDYCAWAERTFSDTSKYYRPIYVFLLPGYKINKVKPKSIDYLTITYQNLVDRVIEPVAWKCNNNFIRGIIKSYLQCLTAQIDYEKGGIAMATIKEEKELLYRFIQENKTLLISVLKEGLQDELDEKTINKVIGAIKDTTNYVLNNDTANPLAKNRLVLAVIKKYVDDNNPTYDDLKKVFPKSINKKHEIVISKTDFENKRKQSPDVEKRYFTNSLKNEPIQINDKNANIIYVCSQWGIDNIKDFIDAAKKLGYDIQQA